ncbi:spore coat protein [Neobacillus sp. Marseille-QA0830]
MDDSSKNQSINNKMIDLLVNDILRKNGVDLASAKGRLSEEQKQQIKELVNDLTQQVNQFMKPPNPPEEKKKNNKNNA